MEDGDFVNRIKPTRLVLLNIIVLQRDRRVTIVISKTGHVK